MSALRVTASGLRGPAHLLYAASWLRPQLETGRGPVTLVDLDGDVHHGRAFARELAARVSGSGTVEVVDEHPAGPGDAVYLAVGSPGIKPWVTVRRAHGRDFRTVVVDEGLGSYGGWRSRRQAIRREGANEPSASLRAAAVSAAKRLLTSERWPLYLQHDGSWDVNACAAREFRPARADRIATDRPVYLTQPWVEIGLLSARDYGDHLELIADAAKRAGVEIVVHPHPGERLAKYGRFEVLAPGEPAEIESAVRGAPVVLGEVSTALLNLAAIADTRVIRVALPGPVADTVRPDERQKGLLDTFLPPPVDPADLGEVLAALRT